MTYGELAERLRKLTKKQLSMTATIMDCSDDEVYPIVDTNVADLLGNPEYPVLVVD